MNDRSSTVDQVSESVWKRKQRYQEHVNLEARVPNSLPIYQQDTFTLLCYSPYCVYTRGQEFGWASQ